MERRRLEEQIKEIESQIEHLPDGKIICKRNQKRYKWYQIINGKQIYISKKNRQLAEELTAKKYLMHLHEDLVQEKMQSTITFDITKIKKQKKCLQRCLNIKNF